jgi:hypothetical protein
MEERIREKEAADQQIEDKAKYAAAAASTEKLSQKSAEFAKTAGSAAQAAYAYQKEVSNTLYETEKLAVKNKADLNELIVRLENAEDNDAVFTTCILALNVATGALKSMKVLMDHFAHFWDSVSRFTNDMGIKTIQESFKTNTAIEGDPEDPEAVSFTIMMANELFKDTSFYKKSGIALLKWKALETMMGYISDRSGDVVSKIEADYKVERGTAADAQKFAATLASTMKVEMDALKDESEAKHKLEEGGAESK